MMVTINVRLEYVVANPWQPREGEDQEHIKKIALSIAQDGLMQVPVGRLIDANGAPVGIDEACKYAGPFLTVQAAWDSIFGDMGCRIQLAFGHSRLAAFRWLEAVKGNSNLVGDWSRIPVALRDIADEEMFRLGVGENLARKDLNAMEEARAMLRYRDQFGKTSAEIGELFGLAESSVRNKMRLVGLPEDIQAALSEGRISEGAARELLRLFDLPKEMQEKGAINFQMPNDSWNYQLSIVERALGGATADQVHLMINHLIIRNGKNLHEAEWKWEDAFILTWSDDIRKPTCKACEAKLTLDGKTICPAFKCYFAKREQWIERRLAEASKVCGIKVPADHNDCGSISVPAEVRSSGCQNLRVQYVGGSFHRVDPDALVPGFSDVEIVCGNRNAICTCMNGLAARKAAEERARRSEAVISAATPASAAAAWQATEKRMDAEMALRQVGQPVARPAVEPDTQPMNADALREAAREERRRQKVAAQEIIGLREEFARRLRDAALLQLNRFAFYQLVNQNESTFKVEQHKDRIGSVEETLFQAGLAVAANITQYFNKPDTEYARKAINKILAAMEIREIEAPAPDEPVYVPVDEAAEEPLRLGWRTPEGEQVDREIPQNGPRFFPGQKPGEPLSEYFKRMEDEGAVDAEFPTL
jgi:ParB/RepB/Spo0J family partition protein